MNSVHGVVLAIVVIAAVAGPGFAPAAWAGTEAGGAEALPILSQIDEAVIDIEDLDQWMVRNQVRGELRQMNRAMGSACERLRDVEAMAAALARDASFPSDPARSSELKRLQSSLVLLGSELSGWQSALRELALHRPTSAEPVTEGERQDCLEKRSEILGTVTRLESRAGEVHALAVRNQARPELCEAALALGTALRELAPVTAALERLQRDPSLDRGCLSRIQEAQSRLAAMLRQIESCQGCVENLSPKS